MTRSPSMRTVSCLALAALGLAASVSLANAQATNFSRTPGDAPALYGSSDARYHRGWHRRAMAPRYRMHWSHPGYYAYGSYGGPYRYYYGRTEGIPPALYHAGDPQFWR